MGDMDDIVKEFLVESYENLDQLDRNLVALEQAPTDLEILSSVFRTIHTIKGTCGFLGFGKLEKVAHVGESLLSLLRDGELRLSPEITSGLLAMVDAVRQMLASIEAMGQDGEDEYPALIATLTRLQEGDSAPQPPAPSEVIAQPLAEARAPKVPTRKEHTRKMRENIAAAVAEAAAISDRSPTSSVTPVLPDMQAAAQSGGGEPHVSTVHKAKTTSQEPESSVFSPQPLDRSPASPDSGLGSPDSGPTSAVSDSTIRVDVGLLDKLMNLVGELVLARNQVLQFTTSQENTVFVATSQRLNLITTELQEGVMKTRMQPIGTVWSKFPRVVRDLALACGKQVRVEMDGKETELDKTIIEAIKDPLTHMVRNSIDHGIESPEARRAAGKPAEGCLLLKAFHEGGQVNIEIADDGTGINFDRVKQKALERGLITPEQAARMSDREVTNLIFLPGFSTVEKVTNVSGRGVGMDVVKTNIEKIGGTVDLQSKSGHGSTFKVKIPLTLAIIPALTITSGGDRYAIPQVNLLELVRLEGRQAGASIEMIHGAPVYRLRGNLLPLVYLNRELLVQDRAAGEGEDHAVNIVVLQADEQQFGLVVDEINDTQEIVVKPLGKQLKGTTTFAGATIMGDGKVALILDVLGIAQRASVVSEVRDRALTDKVMQSQAHDADRQTLLLFRAGDNSRMAIPLSLVARLEEFPLSTVERTGGQEVVQYRGQIMPLIRLSSILGGMPDTEQDPIQVVVYADQGRSVGLVVDRILDIVEETVTVQNRVQRDGMIGSAVIQQRVTDLLDVPGIIRAVIPGFFAEAA